MFWIYYTKVLILLLPFVWALFYVSSKFLQLYVSLNINTHEYTCIILLFREWNDCNTIQNFVLFCCIGTTFYWNSYKMRSSSSHLWKFNGISRVSLKQSTQSKLLIYTVKQVKITYFLGMNFFFRLKRLDLKLVASQSL